MIVITTPTGDIGHQVLKHVVQGSRGMSEAFAQGLAEMMTAKNEGIDNTSSRAVAADTPTTFRQWNETVLKPAVAG